jgi:hypothetical protein
MKNLIDFEMRFKKFINKYWIRKSGMDWAKSLRGNMIYKSHRVIAGKAITLKKLQFY